MSGWMAFLPSEAHCIVSSRSLQTSSRVVSSVFSLLHPPFWLALSCTIIRTYATTSSQIVIIENTIYHLGARFVQELQWTSSWSDEGKQSSRGAE